MNIVVTDGYTLNPGDLYWDSITTTGNVIIYDRTIAADLYERCKDADIILTNKVPFSRDMISSLKQLKCIAVTATGYNIIDTIAARENNIVVCNVPTYGTASVAQHTIALLLALFNNVCINSRSVANGEWVTAKDWCYTKAPVTELSGKTLGLIGFGNIGQQAAKIAMALGMQIVYNATADKNLPGCRFSSIKDIFSKADAVSLHCPLTPANTGFVSNALLQTMKASAYIINTARGPLINENDLAAALNNGVIAGAGLDVLSTEPPSADNPLLTAKHCIITPHNAWISREARERMMAVTAENIKAFIAGKPINRVV
jgi:glycerate dehydrogenase